MNTVYSRRQLQYLDAMGIPAWTRRQPRKNNIAPLSAGSPAVIDDFAAWLSGVHLARSAKLNALEGDAQAALLIIEDATLTSPGQRPFAGPSSRLFDAMLKAIELDRRTTLLGTLADPAVQQESTDEALGSLPGISPRAVLFYSVPSGQHRMNDFDALRECAHVLTNGVPCVVSYHPAYLKDHNELKRAAWNDLKRVRQLLD